MTDAFGQTLAASPEWWRAVHSVAASVREDGLQPDDASATRDVLERLGYSCDGIHKALDWLERAALSGSLHDALLMLPPQRSVFRVTHPLEYAHLHPDVWARIESYRLRGILPDELAERLIEGLRAVDARDLDDDEMTALLDALLAGFLPKGQDAELSRLLRGERRRLHH